MNAFDYWFDYIVRNGEYVSAGKSFMIVINGIVLSGDDEGKKLTANYWANLGSMTISCVIFIDGQAVSGDRSFEPSNFDSFLESGMSRYLLERMSIA